MVGAASDTYNYTGVRKSTPIFIPDGRNRDPSLYLTSEIATHVSGTSISGISWE